MYTTIRHELRNEGKTWPGTLADPCLLSGGYNRLMSPDA
jgi:hypothetical protein